MKHDIATTLKNARMTSGLSQREAARLAGITAVWLCNIETRKGAASWEVVRRLAILYKLNLRAIGAAWLRENQ